MTDVFSQATTKLAFLHAVYTTVFEGFLFEQHGVLFPRTTAFSFEALLWAYNMFWSRALLVPEPTRSL